QSVANRPATRSCACRSRMGSDDGSGMARKEPAPRSKCPMSQKPRNPQARRGESTPPSRAPARAGVAGDQVLGLATDIKGENWSLTVGWRARFGRTLLFDPTNTGSAAYNPLRTDRLQGRARAVQGMPGGG